MTPTTATGTISVSEEYRNLVDKSFSKFSRLRELPPYGRSKWDAYFHKAFQVYSKLWKYQQENRHKLVETGLKRWEIGEIASRIGQLYYNYYLRTSDAKFLSESYIFYEAIMSREYFKDTGRDPSLANKHLRFYARFIVVCLLLNRREMVHQLIRQFRVLVDDYGHIFQASDTKEWKIVVQEIMRFMKADVACESSRPLRYSVLLDPHPAVLSEVVSPEVGKTLRLQDAILASYYHNEVKFNELTLDTFRMLQSMEWEPAGMLYRTRSSDATSNASSAGPAAINKSSLHLQIPDPSLPANPHKYILYRPTVSSLLLVLATACEELSSDGILLLYISASGVPFQGSQTGSVSASSGSEANLDSPTEVAKRSNSVDSTRADTFPNRDGSMLGRSRSSSRDNLGNQSAVDADLFATSGGLLLGNKRNTGANYLYPSDLLPFTRRPLIIIIDSENSAAFEVISGRERGDPAALLLSPVLQPVDEKGSSAAASSGQSSGNLFTFFLTAPSLALCRMVGVSTPNLQTGIYDQIEKTVSTLAIQVGSLLSASSSIEPTWGQILGDPFLRQLIFRFVLCRAIYSLHSLYRSREEYIPRCLPILPDEASPTSKVLETGVFQLASKLGVADQFVFSPSTLDPTRSNGELKWNAKSPARRSNHVREQNTSHFERSDASVLGGSAGRTMVGGR